MQAEPELRIVGERLSAGGVVLLETALRDPGRRTVQAAWHTGGSAPVTRAPLPDDRLGTALLPLRVAGKTDGQRQVLAAAEQMVVALRSVFACDPQPDWMGAPVPTGTGRLLTGCDNLADVLWRTREECGRRHAQLVAALSAGSTRSRSWTCAPSRSDDGTVRAVLDRADGARTELARLGYGELRYVALALVLLTGPGVLDVDPAGEVPAAMQTLTLLADGLDRGLDARQRAELLRLAVRMAERGHIRCVGAVSDGSWAARTDGVTVVRPGAVTEQHLDVAKLQRRLAEFAAARNWQPFHTPKNLVAALSVEASELVEIFQWLTPEESAARDGRPGHRAPGDGRGRRRPRLSAAAVRGARRRPAGGAGREDRPQRAQVPGALAPAGDGVTGVTRVRFHSPQSKSGPKSICCPQISVFLWLFAPHALTLGSGQRMFGRTCGQHVGTDGGGAWTRCGSS